MIKMNDAVLTADTSADPNGPTLFVEDLSGSMRGLTPSGTPKIQESEEVSTQIVQGIAKDPTLAASIDLMIIGFPGMKDEAEVLRPFGPVDANTRVTLDVSPQYGTPIAAAIELALDSIEERRRYYRTKNISAKRPHIFLKTDGGATDSPDALEAVGKRVRALKDAGKLEMFILFIADSIADEQREALEQLEAVFGVKPNVFAPGQIKNMFTLVSVSLKAQGKTRAAAFTPASGLSDRQAGD